MKRKLFTLLLSATIISGISMESFQSVEAKTAKDITINITTENTPKATTQDIPFVTETPNNSTHTQDISKSKITVVDSVTYNGKEQKPAVTLNLEGKIIPKENYTVVYKNNVNAGIAQILITGMGEFTGSVQTSFQILPKDISTLTCADIPNKVYTGKAMKPDITLQYENITLKKDKDYTLTYTNNKEIGNVSVTVKGMGNYTGTRTINFQIVPKKVASFQKAKSTSTTIKLKWKKSASASGYQIFQYDKKTKKYKLKKTLPAKTTSYTIKKLSPYTEYRFKICAYKKVGSKKYYSEDSKVLKVKTLLAAPKMTLTSNRKGQVVLGYKKVKKATKLEIYYKKGKGSYIPLGEPLKNADNTIFFSGLTEGATYTFKIRGYRESNGKKVYGDDCTKKVTISSQGSVLNGGEYTEGSIYGPSLTQAELSQVREQVQYFKDHYIDDGMSDYLKVQMAHDYLASVCSYAPDWSKNRANTAWGALVYGEAQCSGYARAMKALCDGIGIECYYVHANSNAANPSHQWNEVKVDGNWYIIDVQCNDSSGYRAVFLMSDSSYANLSGMDWDRQSVPPCPKDY